MRIFDDLRSEQVSSIHHLYKLLRKLRVIGLVKTKTSQFSHAEFGRPIRYKVEFVSYHPEFKGKMTPEEALDELMRLSFEFKLYDDEDDTEPTE